VGGVGLIVIAVYLFRKKSLGHGSKSIEDRNTLNVAEKMELPVDETRFDEPTYDTTPNGLDRFNTAEPLYSMDTNEQLEPKYTDVSSTLFPFDKASAGDAGYLEPKYTSASDAGYLEPKYTDVSPTLFPFNETSAGDAGYLEPKYTDVSPTLFPFNETSAGLKIGDRVNVLNFGDGTVKFIGLHAKDGKPRAGIVLDEMKGLNNGTAGGHYYFSCADKHGVLVDPRQCKVSAVASTVKDSLQVKVEPVSAPSKPEEAQQLETAATSREKSKAEPVTAPIRATESGGPTCACGNSLNPSNKFCGECGAAVATFNPPAAKPGVAPQISKKVKIASLDVTLRTNGLSVQANGESALYNNVSSGYLDVDE